MLGAFVLPFFVFSWFIGVFGIAIILYRVIRIIILNFLSTSMSIQAQTAVLAIHDVNLVPNVLLFMGLVVFFFSLTYTLIAFFSIKEDRTKFKRPGILPITFYIFLYLLIYPIILIISAFKLIVGKKKW